ncbi:YD repeat-containing protein, partial [Melghirimyces profundicolus]
MTGTGCCPRTSAATVAYNYDPFGRLNSVTAAGEVIEKYTYDSFDRVAEHSKLQEDGSTKKTSYVYDPLDRTVSRTEGTKTTDFHYLGLSGQVLNEEVAGEIQKSYQYSPWGERLSMVKHNSDGTEEDSYYGYNPHTDTEVLTDEKRQYPGHLWLHRLRETRRRRIYRRGQTGPADPGPRTLQRLPLQCQTLGCHHRQDRHGLPG